MKATQWAHQMHCALSLRYFFLAVVAVVEREGFA